jgi:hypothetical protein
MTQVRFEPMIPVFEQVKTVHALDRAATVIGIIYTERTKLMHNAKIKSAYLSVSPRVSSPNVLD